MWLVLYPAAVEQEREKLPGKERAALYNAVRKLESIGPRAWLPAHQCRQSRGRAEGTAAEKRTVAVAGALPAGGRTRS